LNILITGSTGFVGKNLLSYFKDHDFSLCDTRKNDLSIIDYNKENIDAFIHLAGKAHDLKKNAPKDEYYTINTKLTEKIFDEFLESKARIFIFLSSVKAVADDLEEVLTENHNPNPISHYGKSKLLAEQYILSKQIPNSKKVYILRPCMIYGPGNKGNLNLLYNIVKKGIPWPLGAYKNRRSFCSIDNLCFIIKHLLDKNNNIPSGVYNVSDDEGISTNQIVKIIAECTKKKVIILNIPRLIIKFIAKIGDFFNFSVNSENLKKLTETYLVSNQKIKLYINEPLPIKVEHGLRNVIESLN
jgi:nucleoside-diphosphate-sugar epimerase